MNRLLSLLMVVVLGVALHLAFSRLSYSLPERFPHLVPAEPKMAEVETVQEEPTPPESSPPLLTLQEPSVRPFELLEPSEFHFSVPPLLESAVGFWRDIYSRYDSNQVVLHDNEDLSIRYAVLNLGELDSSLRDQQVEAEMERVRAGLSDTAADRLRSQTGLRDKFLHGLKISGRYLPIFEEIFVSYGLPKELTRLVFVESLFQDRAFSKVSAAGLWQIMPATGRLHRLQVSRFVDERFDPILSTHAAAKLLQKNYRALGSWPLAINAYNSGVGRLRKAVEALGTKDIGLIVRQYRSASYGFASRNFYPEFLAALEIADHSEKYFGAVSRELPWMFEEISLPVRATFPQIAFLSDASLVELKQLNPAFAPVVFEGEFSLPAGSRIRIPQGKTEMFAARFVRHYRPGEVIPTSYAKGEL